MESLRLNITLPVEPEQLYNDWLNSKTHTAFTGGKAKMSTKANGRFTAWNGYITGHNIELVSSKKIVQAWRTSEFDEDAPDSIVELDLEPKGYKTILHLYHYDLQKGDARKYKQGWKDHYFTPMKEYYERLEYEKIINEKRNLRKNLKKDSVS